MKRLILISFLILLLTTACTNDKAGILFNKYPITKENIYDYEKVFPAGARIYYVLFNLSYYLSNPIEIFYIWHGGLAIHGGILGGLLYLLIGNNCKIDF